MTTLQQYLDQKYPTREDKEKVTEISVWEINGERKVESKEMRLEGGKLNLSEFKNLEKFDNGLLLLKTPLIELDLSGCINLSGLFVTFNNLTSVDFLNNLPNPEKLEKLFIPSNNIQPTDIEVFSKFVNLRELKIGNIEDFSSQEKYNRFYGSFKSWKDLAKLETICIEETDVNEGLEYLPFSLVQSTTQEKLRNAKSPHAWGGYFKIECSPHKSNAKCFRIQDQLRKYDYDAQAWQLTHPAQMFEARPELFSSENSKEKWVNALDNKLKQTNDKILDYKQNQNDEFKKIGRLETKLRELKRIKQLLEERSIFEDSLQTGVRWYGKFKEDKAIQTDLTYSQITDKK